MENNDEKIDFSFEVEKLKSLNKELTYLDCILELCETHNVEIESVKSLLSKPIKDKMKIEAEKLRLIKTKTNDIFI